MRRSRCGRTRPSAWATTEARPSAPTTRRLAHLAGRARGVVEPDARHPARLHAQPGDAVTLARVQRKLPGPLVEDVVEPCPRDGEAVPAIAAPRRARRISALQPRAVGRDDAHARDGLAASSTALRTPRRSRMRADSGERYSPQILGRGNDALSSRSTDQPRSASRMAVALPAGPAPTTTTSYALDVIASLRSAHHFHCSLALRLARLRLRFAEHEAKPQERIVARDLDAIHAGAARRGRAPPRRCTRVGRTGGHRDATSGRRRAGE